MLKIKQNPFAMSIMAILSMLMCAWLFANQTSTAQTAFDCTAVTEIPTSECEALVAIYNSGGGENWYNWVDNAWLESTTPCSWHYVDCTNGSVTELNLSSNISRTVAPEIGNLTNLTTLDLSWGGLTSLPAEIGNLSNLTKLLVIGNEFTALPPAIGNLSSLIHLDVNDNPLTSLPAEIGGLSNLVYLNVSDNLLTSLPPEIGDLSNLDHLSVTFNPLTSLPAEIGNLSNLTQLDIYGNELTSLPPAMSNLFNLTRLDVKSNALTSLPPAIGGMYNLTYLNVGSNPLVSLPDEIGNLYNLEIIELSSTSLTSLPPAIGNLSNLMRLYARESELTSLPAAIGNLSNLTDLDLFNSNLTALPATIGNLSNLSSINLYDNEVIWLPPEIGNLSNLTHLDMQYNALTTLPTTIGDLSSLMRLDVTGNQLWSVPAEIGNLSGLGDLYLADNNLTSLPAEIGNLSNLRSLNLINNQLTSLPPTIGNLSGLYWLGLINNQLTSLPAEIGNLSSLGDLNVDGNQLTTLPPEIGNLSLAWLTVSDNPITSWPSSLTNLTLTALFLDSVCEPGDPDLQAWLDGTHTSHYYRIPTGRYTHNTIIYDTRTGVLCSETAIAGKVWVEGVYAVSEVDNPFVGDAHTRFEPRDDDWVVTATVKLTAIDTGETITTTTDALGRYTFRDIPFGQYEITLDEEAIDNADTMIQYAPNGRMVVDLSAETPNIMGQNFIYLDGCGYESITGIPEAECRALIALYNSTDGENWTDEARTGWLTSSSPCTWEGVTCADGHVDSIILNEAGLSGDIPAAIADLTALESIVLNDNNITSLPSTIGQMSLLRVLTLNGNQLTSLPAEIGNLSDLDALALGENQLSAVPSTFVNMTNLRNLSLADNQFSVFPPELLDLTNMVNLQLDGNQLTTIPATIDTFSNLERLSVGNNQITTFPSTLGNLSQLLVLGLNGNLATMLPAEIGSLPRLQGLNISDNPLTAWPDSFANLTTMYMLGMESVCEPAQPELQTWLSGITDVAGRGSAPCILTPPDPSTFSCANVTDMVTAECDALVALYNSTDGANWNPERSAGWLEMVNPCDWEGVVCDSDFDYGTVNTLQLDEMWMSGAIPPEIGDLTNIVSLALSRNYITSLPAEIGNLQNLSTLFVNDNRITALPAGIGNTSNLQIVDVSNNPITSWPSSISNLQFIMNFTMDNVCEPTDPALQTWLDATLTNLFQDVFSQTFYESRTGVLCSEAAVAGKVWIEALSAEEQATLGIPDPSFEPFEDEQLADITVRLVDSATRAVVTTTTNSDGRYTFRDVPFADYEVEVDRSSLPVGASIHYSPHGPTFVTISADNPNALGKDFVYIGEETPLTVGGTETGAEGAEGMVFLPFVVVAGATTAAVRHANAQ